MAGLNVSKWQAARRKAHYDPVMQFYLRQIRTALDEARGVKDRDADDTEAWDRAIMARAWICRPAPKPHVDRAGYILSFQHACEVLGLEADVEMVWMLEAIDACGDFDTDEVHERIQYLTDNPPDDVEEPLFEGFRVVPVLDQGSLFDLMGAA